MRQALVLRNQKFSGLLGVSCLLDGSYALPSLLGEFLQKQAGGFQSVITSDCLQKAFPLSEEFDAIHLRLESLLASQYFQKPVYQSSRLPTMSSASLLIVPILDMARLTDSHRRDEA